jgi:hypothetical protein
MFPLCTTDNVSVESGVRFIIKESWDFYKEQLNEYNVSNIKTSIVSYLANSNISDRRPSLET